MRAPRKTNWTPEQVARLEALIAAGASAIRAAAALNRKILGVQTKARQIGKPFLPQRSVRRARLAKEAAATLRQQGAR